MKLTRFAPVFLLLVCCVATAAADSFQTLNVSVKAKTAATAAGDTVEILLRFGNDPQLRFNALRSGGTAGNLMLPEIDKGTGEKLLSQLNKMPAIKKVLLIEGKTAQEALLAILQKISAPDRPIIEYLASDLVLAHFQTGAEFTQLAAGATTAATQANDGIGLDVWLLIGVLVLLAAVIFMLLLKKAETREPVNMSEIHSKFEEMRNMLQATAKHEETKELLLKGSFQELNPEKPVFFVLKSNLNELNLLITEKIVKDLETILTKLDSLRLQAPPEAQQTLKTQLLEDEIKALKQQQIEIIRGIEDLKNMMHKASESSIRSSKPLI